MSFKKMEKAAQSERKEQAAERVQMRATFTKADEVRAVLAVHLTDSFDCVNQF